MDGWSWPKFHLMAAIADEAEMGSALLTAQAVLAGKEVQAEMKVLQARLRGEDVPDPGEWRPPSLDQLKAQMEMAGQNE